MKHIKIYEEWDDDIGSWVMIKSHFHEKYKDFYENHIGQVIKMYYISWYRVDFIVPEKISGNLENYISREYNGCEIEFKSKSKEEAEEYLKMKQNTKKFNL